MKISNIIPPITKRPIPGIPVPKFPWPFGWNEVIYIVEVCASASAFTAGIVIGKKIGQTIKGK